MELDLEPYQGESPDEARERRIKNAVQSFLRGKRGRRPINLHSKRGHSKTTGKVARNDAKNESKRGSDD